MTTVLTGKLLILFLPFALSLLGQSAQARVLCLVTGTLGLLLSVEPYGAVMPWVLGMLISGVSLWERLRQWRMV